MKHPNRRWYPHDKKKAYRIAKRQPLITILAFVFGIILTLGVLWGGNVLLERREDTQIISSLIQECNPSFDPVFADATARYIVKNSGPYDPVFLAVIGYYEGSWRQKSKSDKGAEGFFQIKPHGSEHRLSKAERLFLEYQLEKAIERLEGKYKKYGTVYKMHYSYVGAIKNKPVADNYMAKIYTKFAEEKGFIWKQPRQIQKLLELFYLWEGEKDENY